VKALPADTVILTAGCAKYRFNKLDLGKINGIPRILDAGQCGDAYSIVRIVLELQNALGIRTLENLPVSFVFSWYEQRDLAVFLSLLTLGFKNIRLGPAFPAFFAPSVLEVLTRDYGVKPIDSPEADAEAMMNGN
jgi:hydroxylamine reductase